MNKVLLTVVLAGITSTSTGCFRTIEGMDPFGGEDTGRFLISADAEGMRAWSDYQSGVVTNGKASADTHDTPYYEMRRTQISNRNQRKSNYQQQLEARGATPASGSSDVTQAH